MSPKGPSHDHGHGHGHADADAHVDIDVDVDVDHEYKYPHQEWYIDNADTTTTDRRKVRSAEIRDVLLGKLPLPLGNCGEPTDLQLRIGACPSYIAQQALIALDARSGTAGACVCVRVCVSTGAGSHRSRDQ